MDSAVPLQTPPGDGGSFVPLPTGILVVDDEDAIRTLLRRALTLAGYTFFEAASGAGAVAVYEREAGNIGVVLMDVRMPAQDGVETFHALRAINSDVRCVLMSADFGGYPPDQLRALGAELLPKPFHLPEVIELLRRLLEPDGDR
jgi:CheY-like chemotaxis protein